MALVNFASKVYPERISYVDNVLGICLPISRRSLPNCLEYSGFSASVLESSGSKTVPTKAVGAAVSLVNMLTKALWAGSSCRSTLDRSFGDHLHSSTASLPLLRRPFLSRFREPQASCQCPRQGLCFATSILAFLSAISSFLSPYSLHLRVSRSGTSLPNYSSM